jgi:hypothetical protein
MKFPAALVYEDNTVFPNTPNKELESHIAPTPFWLQASHSSPDVIVGFELSAYGFCPEDEMSTAFKKIGNGKFYKPDAKFSKSQLLNLYKNPFFEIQL